MEEGKTTTRAVAIHYDKEAGGAPRVVARGKGNVAEDSFPDGIAPFSPEI